MNLPEMHDTIDFWVDRAKAPRLTKVMRDKALNTAIDSYVKDRHGNIKQSKKRLGFEITEQVREELYTILIDNLPLTLIGNTSVAPADFYLHIGMFITGGGKRRLSHLATYQENDLDDNAFTSPNIDYPVHRRTSTGFTHELGGVPLTTVELSYLKHPSVVGWNENLISQGVTLLSTRTYYVVTGPVTNNGITYQSGQTFIAVGNLLGGTGTVNLVTNSDLPINTHEEICKIAASIIMKIYENPQKAVSLDQESMRS